jgi:hypothetical protein
MSTQAYSGPLIEPITARSVHCTSPLNDVHFPEIIPTVPFDIQIFHPGSTARASVDETTVSVLMGALTMRRFAPLPVALIASVYAYALSAWSPLSVHKGTTLLWCQHHTIH